MSDSDTKGESSFKFIRRALQIASQIRTFSVLILNPKPSPHDWLLH